MKKFKLFVDNLLVYGIGGVISKIVPLIMIPIVVYLMPNSDYVGISDMSNTIMNFCISLAVLGMYDAMYRMFFDKDNEDFKRQVCSTALVFNIGTSCVVFVLMIVLKGWISKVFFDSDSFSYIVYITALATLVGGTNSIISAPTRMQNKRKIFLITNTIGPILSYSISIPLLLKGYYIIALPLAGAISGLTMEISFGILNRKWFSFGLFNKKILKQLLIIALPLVPNFLIYWIFNSSDRLMITHILGLGASGIYSVGAKFGMASQLIYTAFAGGWQFFAFSTMNEENQVENNSSIFDYLGGISFASTMLICLIARPICILLFPNEYSEAYIVAPYLFLAPLLQMLFQVAANQFLVVKKTLPNLFILIIGAVANVFLNLYLIPRIGIEGASIATLTGYAISVIICVIVLSQKRLFVVSRKIVFVTGIGIIFLLLWRLFFTHNILVTFLMMLGSWLLYLIIYFKDISNALKIFKNKKSK